MLADVSDTFRAVAWKLRRAAIRLYGSVTRRDQLSRLATLDSESPAAMFNHVLVGVCRAIPASLPAEVVLTPVNIVEFSGPFPDGRLFSRAQNDGTEVWRRVRKHLRRHKGRIECTTAACDRPRMLEVTVTVHGDDRMVVHVRESERIPTPAEVEKRLGLEPGKPATVTGSDLATLLNAHLAHERGPEGADGN